MQPAPLWGFFSYMLIRGNYYDTTKNFGHAADIAVPNHQSTGAGSHTGHTA